MVWFCIAAAIVGISIGLWFRVPALLFGAAVLTVVTVVLKVVYQWPLSTFLLRLLLVLAVLQVGYLAGVWLIVFRTHLRSQQRPPSPD